MEYFLYHFKKKSLSFSQMNYILEDTSVPAVGEEKLASLTAGERTAWANTRSEFFFKGTNRISLDAIEKSAFVVTLDDVAYEFDEVSIATVSVDFTN